MGEYLAHVVSPSDLFTAVLKELATSSLLRGFKRRGSYLRRRVDCNQLLVNLQRSTSSTRDHIRFVVNVGIVCDTLLRFFLEEDARPSGADHANSHWRMRVGNPQERWFEIDASTDPVTLAREVEDELRPVLEQASAALSDAALVSIWKSGRGPGLGDFELTKNLAVLAKKIGDDAALESALAAMQELVDRHDYIRATATVFRSKLEVWQDPP